MTDRERRAVLSQTKERQRAHPSAMAYRKANGRERIYMMYFHILNPTLFQSHRWPFAVARISYRAIIFILDLQNIGIEWPVFTVNDDSFVHIWLRRRYYTWAKPQI